jgi:hypothetical protein
MDPRCRILARRLLVASLSGLAMAPVRAADASAEQIVGGIEAVVFVCTPIDPKSVRPGLDMLRRAAEQRKLDLAAIRKTDAYRGTYNSEVNRLLSLTLKDRASACQHAW